MTVKSFDPSSFESRWQKTWEEKGVYQPDLLSAKKPLDKSRGKPFYNLMMFPYPSAEGLHVGNMYAFTGVDIYGRFKRMQGNDVFEPIGLDGFGIHSENYAIKIGKNPKEQAKISEKNFYRQLRAIGNGFAWQNRLETYDPDYYKWTQWLFIQMFKKGLAYKKKSPVNFCPSCKTVLSDEQVIEGVCERCKTQVEKRDMEQWFFRITKYAERLLQNTFKPEFKWSEKVKVGQQNWIGKKTGINISYEVVDEKGQPTTNDQRPTTITCFTTRPDTNFGATFVVIAPEHPFVASLLNSKFPSTFLGTSKTQKSKLDETKNYVEKSKKKTSRERIAQGREKTGVFTGFYCVNQLNGYKMPLFISDFVLTEFGTGAVVGVPASDIRDFEFAKKFKLPVIRVIVGEDQDRGEIKNISQVKEEGILINSEFLNGLERHVAGEKMMDYIEEKGWGKRVTTYKLRDWCISRQRYWGAPIPMIYCESCAKQGFGWPSLHQGKNQESRIRNQGKNDKNIHDSYFMIHDSNPMAGWFPVPEDQLPVLLPDLDDWKPEGTGKGPLAKLESFVKTKCPNCGGEADRETDVCDTFLDSSWYFLRYPSVVESGKDTPGVPTESGRGSPEQKRGDSPGVEESVLPWDPVITRHWLPVNMYIGGAEHTVLHLLYSRFVTMALEDMGYLDFEEPYKEFYAHGLIIAEGAKMSKSRGNIIIPDEYIAKYGADALRTYLMFLGPFDMGGDFRDTGIAGMHKFLGRVWRLVSEYIAESGKRKAERGTSSLKSPLLAGEGKGEVLRTLHHAVKEVTQDLESLRYNTAIAHIMVFVNQITESVKNTSDGGRPSLRGHDSSEVEGSIKTLLLLLAPFAPHMTEELWQKMNQELGIKNYGENNKKKIHNSCFMIHNSIHLHPWPTFDLKYLVEDTATIVVQVNGKVRDTIKVKSEKLALSVYTERSRSGVEGSKVKSEMEKEAKKSEKLQKYLEGKTIRKVIFVPGRLINFVI